MVQQKREFGTECSDQHLLPVHFVRIDMIFDAGLFHHNIAQRSHLLDGIGRISYNVSQKGVNVTETNIFSKHEGLLSELRIIEESPLQTRRLYFQTTFTCDSIAG